jgi:hypothetical protein
MRGFSAVFTVSLVIPITPLSAQQPPPVEPGARVRVGQECRDAYTGRGATGLGRICPTDIGVLTAMTSDSIVLNTAEEGDLLAFALDSVTRIDVHRGRKSKWLLGMGIGFLAGSGAGALVGTSLDCTEYLGTTSNEASCTGLGALGGAAVGAVVGALVGSSIRTDKWEEVPLDRLRVNFVPKLDGRIVLGFSIAF